MAVINKYTSLLLWSILFALGFSASSGAASLPRTAPIPGGIVIIPLGAANNPSPPPRASFQDRRVMVLENGHEWHAVVGIPLHIKPGPHKLQINPRKGATRQISFTVQAKEYKTQYITIKNKRQVNPSKSDLKRIAREKKKIVAALRHWSHRDEVQTRFILPVVGRLSSPFGLRRFFNKQPRKPHSGIDIAAPRGTPLKAPANAEVISTGKYFFNGNTVFLDHGQGLVTMYCHMDRIGVKPGQKITQGEIFGAIGMTGRVTGPHVHWSVSLNDARVDPNLFFRDEIIAELTKAKTGK